MNGLPPHELDSNHVKDFLSDLAVERNVAPSTQNQAFNATRGFMIYTHVARKNKLGVKSPLD